MNNTELFSTKETLSLTSPTTGVQVIYQNGKLNILDKSAWTTGLKRNGCTEYPVIASIFDGSMRYKDMVIYALFKNETTRVIAYYNHPKKNTLDYLALSTKEEDWEESLWFFAQSVSQYIPKVMRASFMEELDELLELDYLV